MIIEVVKNRAEVKYEDKRSEASEELLWELFVQAGPVVNVYVPKDRVTNLHQGYGFVEFRSEEDADYVSISCCCDIFVNLCY
ncbi:putative RNA recognition motif domain, nucleotide-binding alpha-beta plait domain superfamily [Helianthus annuus]|nr:putative RNA recognition motif domain, nucleotide-binding alpha-beta plait domain superfamily [Helianthus annuus]